MIKEEIKISDEIKKISEELSILPLKGTVVFPSLIIPLVITDQRYAKLIDDTLMGGKVIGLFAQKDPELENPGPNDIHKIGTAGTILKMLRFPDGSVRFLVQGLTRIKIKRFIKEDPFLTARVEPLEDLIEESVEMEALNRTIIDLLKKVVNLAPYLPDDLQISALNIEDPGKLSDLISSNLNITLAQKQDLLETLEV
ncbi:MAG: LON peptidase substrate-binding domain-containing protein, partial [candidate division Zixibacteria bacterium]|nr:LON peptidase substrate-binding domain-containing protein [candidate division Zixibacteria bacterium]